MDCLTHLIVPPYSDNRLFGSVGLVVGNFDGVHRGHQTLIEQSVSSCDKTIIVTFEPHPRDFFAHQPAVATLTPSPLKHALFKAMGVHDVFTINFNRDFSLLSPDTFLDRYVLRFSPSLVVVGEDFRFGFRREGDRSTLLHFAQQNGFKCCFVPPVGDQSGAIISSSRIREALKIGDVGTANRLLGWRWQVHAPVIHGDKRGRHLGYPTLNMTLPEPSVLKHGVYATRAQVDGVWYNAVSSFGIRPQFQGQVPLLETHLFGFSGDVYGQDVTVSFLAFLRDEQTFASVDALVQRMNQDCLLAQAHANAHVYGSYDPYGAAIPIEQRTSIVNTDLMRTLEQ